MVAVRVWRKRSRDGSITLYLTRRRLVDRLTDVDPVHGVLVVEPSYLQNRKVYGQLVCSFRYGREEDEVMGLSFQKDLYLASDQIYPPKDTEPTKLQERLMKKLGANAYPFTFKMPEKAPPSVTLHPGPDAAATPSFGVHYYVRVFQGDHEQDGARSRTAVQLSVQRVQYAPEGEGPQPCTAVRADFLQSPGQLDLGVVLEGSVSRPEHPLPVTINISNRSNTTVTGIKATVRQTVQVWPWSGVQWCSTVATAFTQEGCPVEPGLRLQSVVTLTPQLSSPERGVALDGALDLDSHSTALASTTLLADPECSDTFGLVVSYTVRVKLYLGAMGGEVTAELPFVLMHPKPDEPTDMAD